MAGLRFANPPYGLVAWGKANPAKANYAGTSAVFQLNDGAVQPEGRREIAAPPVQERARSLARPFVILMEARVTPA
jgi:hypothetical protein